MVLTVVMLCILHGEAEIASHELMSLSCACLCRGAEIETLLPMTAGAPCPLLPQRRDWDILLTAETHNFPCAVAPFPGTSLALASCCCPMNLQCCCNANKCSSTASSGPITGLSSSCWIFGLRQHADQPFLHCIGSCTCLPLFPDWTSLRTWMLYTRASCLLSSNPELHP